MSVARRMKKPLMHKYPRAGEHITKPKPFFLKALHPLHEANTLIEFSRAIGLALKNEKTMSHPQDGPLVKSYLDKFKTRTKNWFLVSKEILEEHLALEKAAKTQGKETTRIKEMKRLRAQLQEILIEMEQGNLLEKGFVQSCLNQTRENTTK